MVDGIVDLAQESEDVVFGDGDDLVGNETVPFPVDRLHVLRSCGSGETEHLTVIGIEPVGEELDRVLRLELDIRQVSLCDLLGSDAGQVVAVHEQGHLVPPSGCAIVPNAHPGFGRQASVIRWVVVDLGAGVSVASGLDVGVAVASDRCADAPIGVPAVADEASRL